MGPRARLAGSVLPALARILRACGPHGMAVLLSTAMLLSCADDEPPAAAVVEGPAQAAPDRTSRLGTATAADEGAAPAPPPVPAVAPHLLFPRGIRIMPHDYTIGPLQDLLAAGPAAEEVTATMVTFLRALGEGAIEALAVAPERWRSLTRSIQYHLREGTLPHAARIGEVTVAEERAHAVIRLFGDPGRVAGELYLEGGAEGWRIVDVQLDLLQLALPYTSREQEFAPRSDRWLLLR